MARTYRTKAGDMLDLVAALHYDGRQSGVVEQVLEANRAIGLGRYPGHLPAGLVIVLPDIQTPAAGRPLLDLWG